MKELKCLFCGSCNMHVNTGSAGARYVCCHDCGGHGPFAENEEIAIVKYKMHIINESKTEK